MASGKRFCKRWPFAFQKATFYTPKGHVLQAERRHIGKPLTVNGLQSHGGTHRKQARLMTHVLTKCASKKPLHCHILRQNVTPDGTHLPLAYVLLNEK